jgi:tetratricopeptide (TPR) repeat protein
MSGPDLGSAGVAGCKSPWIERAVLGGICVWVITLYALVAQSGVLESTSLNPGDAYYNLLVQGFRAGQLSLKKDVPPGLAQLPDPYDPVANVLYGSESYGMRDLSCYKGRFYLYFGITPALTLFWPFAALTGHYLFHRPAVLVFCAIAFLVGVGLLRTLWRRYFAGVSVWVVAGGALALGLATGMPMLLTQCDVYEVAISCGFMWTMLALGAIWRALHEPGRRLRWLAAASLAYGLALGARPSLLFGAVILLAPVLQARRERQKMGPLLMAAMGPTALIGLGLMLYNFVRFDDPLEFGQRFQLNEARQLTQHFSPRYLWFNFRVYFLEPARWSGRFPFVHAIAVPPLPTGHEVVQDPFGILTNIPLVWLGLAAPLAWRVHPTGERSRLRAFLTGIGLFVGVYALTLCMYFGACFRFEVEFLPALVLLAVAGILGLEQALADRPIWRRRVRWGWGLLLLFSVAFNLLACVDRYAEARNYRGVALEKAGRVREAIQIYQQVLRIRPDYPEAHHNLAVALEQSGESNAALEHYEQALRLNPNLGEPYYNMGVALERAGNTNEAVRHYEHALRVNPHDAPAHYSLANCLLKANRIDDAIRHYEAALLVNPDYADAHHNLGNAFLQAGRVRDAINQYDLALRLDPRIAEAHYNLGVVLEQVGRIHDAVAHYEQALRLKPDFAEAHCNLANVLRAVGKSTEAIGHYERALRLNPGYAEAHYNLGVTLGERGQTEDAIRQYQEAVRIKPDYAEAHNNLGIALVQAGQTAEAAAQFERALQIKPDLAEAHYNLGFALEQAGRVQDAIEQYQQAVRIRPDFAAAHNALTRLHATQ